MSDAEPTADIILVPLSIYDTSFFRFLLQHWTDPHLTWNSSEYGGLTRLRIPSSRVWVPDIVLYNRCGAGEPSTICI